MRNEQHRATLLGLQLRNEFQNFFLRGHIQGGGGLIANEQSRFQNDGHRNHDALSLTATELMRKTAVHAQRVWQLHAFKDSQYFCLAFFG